MYGLIPVQSPTGLKSSRLSWVPRAAMLVGSKAVVTEAAVSHLVLLSNIGLFISLHGDGSSG